MELGFILSAIRRHFVLVALLAVAAALGAYTLRAPAKYQAHVVLSIQQPSSSGPAVSEDRYVTSQVATLESAELAQKLAQATPGETAESVQSALSVHQRPGSDVVDLFVKERTAPHAEAIANAFVSMYIGDLQASASSATSAQLKIINDDLDRLANTLKQLELQLAEDPKNAVATAEKDTATAEYANRLKDRSAIQPSGQVNTRVVQLASPATTTFVGSSKKLLIAGGFAGLIAGVSAALVLARFSTKVIGPAQVEEALGEPITAVFARPRRTNPGYLIRELPARAQQAIDLQYVSIISAESPAGRAKVVAVMGTQQDAGATPLAIALAGRMARAGDRTVLVDLASGGVTGRALRPSLGGQPVPLHHVPNLARTPLDQLTVLSLPAPLRTDAFEALLDRLAAEGEIVLVDAGSVLRTAANVWLLRSADVVVLAVPAKDQMMPTLATIARFAETRRGSLLPVLTVSQRRLNPLRRRSKASRNVEPAASASPSAARDEPKTAEAKTRNGYDDPARSLQLESFGIDDLTDESHAQKMLHVRSHISQVAEELTRSASSRRSGWWWQRRFDG